LSPLTAANGFVQSWPPSKICPWGRVVNALGCHVQYSVKRSVAGVRLSLGASAYQKIISNSSYTHDEQGVNPGQIRGFDGVLYKMWPLMMPWLAASTAVSVRRLNHIYLLWLSRQRGLYFDGVKVSAALTWEPKQIDVIKSPGWRCRSVNQGPGDEQCTGLAVAEQVPVQA